MASLIAVVTAIWCVALNKTSIENWRLPTEYSGDAIQMLGWFKSVAQGDYHLFGWKNVERLNYPLVANWQNYPMYEEIPTYFLGLVAKFTNLAFAGNVGLLLVRLLAALGFWFAARCILKCSLMWSWVGALAFALLFYHDYRSLGHLLLGFTWIVPILVAVTWRKEIEAKWMVAIGFIIGLSNPYWILASMVLILFSSKIKTMGIFLAGLVAGFLVSNLDTILFSTHYGMIRNYFESEIYALKPMEFFIPPSGLFGNVAKHYFNVAAVRGEMLSPYLGIVGLAGLSWMLWEWIKDKSNRLPIVQVSSIIVCACIGGLTSMMALFGLDMFRGANRFSLFVAVICLLFLVFRLSYSKLSKNVQFFVACLIVVFSCGETICLNRPGLHAESFIYLRDIEFGKKLDGLLPNAKLYSLPPMTFPDSNPFGKVGVYDNLRPWLHTTNVSFSYGQASSQFSKLDEVILEGLKTNNINFLEIQKNNFDGVIAPRSLFTDHGEEVIKRFNLEIYNEDFVVMMFNKSP